MAEIDGKVLDAVEAALKEDPKATVDELLQVALKVNPSLAQLSKRQFHARYPLQVKRKLSPPKPRRPRRKGGSKRGGRGAAPDSSHRDAVRGIFLRFASDLAAAEERKDVVKVVAGVDRYVDEALKAAGGA